MSQLKLQANVIQAIAALPRDLEDLDNNAIGGLLVRHKLAREYLAGLLAQDVDDEDVVKRDALLELIEIYIPALLREITSK